MSSSLRMTLIIMVAILVASVVEGNTKTDCGVAQTAFGMCVPYVMGMEHTVSSSCCMAVRSVKDLSPTRMARRGTCNCLKMMMAQVGTGRVDGRRASGLAGKCGVRTSVIPTSLSFRCFEFVYDSNFNTIRYTAS
ncbi:uncharacterized protein A4U43_C01F26120 [Asparagus officinalis]|uniref:Non-specific lipid-transfer protein n=1 Tax=Asparagus officinalis TaxID=4686 RepID=A0A5P1FT33_ASPOF|nr:uncharacterized protein A4U43_C01F26120 [Asparagus officinalis]